MRNLDVLFAIPGNLVQVYQGLAVGHHTEPPAKARFMASYLMRRGVSVDLIDATITGDTPEQMAQKVQEVNPRLVVIPVYGFNPSSSTHTMPAARALAQAIKALLLDPARRASLAAAAEAWTRSHDAGWTADRFADLYHQVAEGRGQP